MNCVAEGCTNEVNRPKGFCGPHYYRYYTYGDPLAPAPEPRGIRTLRALIADDTDDCIIWPLGLTSTGYGKVKYQGKTRGAHNVALELTVGPKPDDKDCAAHYCRNRACINPRHVRWATTLENVLDKERDGTVARGDRTRRAVLTADIVRLIRSLSYTGSSPTQISRALGLDNGTVRDVIFRRTWRWVDAEKVAA
jgi:hypothetical protein